MDVNGFDDYFDLRDQQEEGQEMKQQQRQQQTDSQTQPPQQVSATKEGDSYKEKGDATDTTLNVSSENTTPSWTEPNQLAESLRQESGDNIANVGSSSSSSSEGANATPQQPYYFPLGGTDWANVFSTGEISGVSLASLLSAQQLQALAGDGGSFMPHLTTEAINPDLSRFIPPQMLMQSSNGPVNDSSVKKETGENQDNSSDKPQSNTAAQEANTLQEETDGRMRTRSSSRQREQAKDISKSTETISATTETPKKRSRAKKLYCTCQKPYTGEPMVQCDICKEWFHCACVDLDPDVAEDIDIWMCKKCEESGAVPERNDRNSEEAEQKQKRQPKMRKCLSRTCNNKTREDSYCSDTCAAEDAMRRTGDSEYIPSSPPASSSRRSSGASDKKTKVMTPKAKAEPPAAATISRNPEDNPIRKNVIKNMTTILKTIIEGALEKDPTLFELNSSKSPKSEEPPAAKQGTEQNRQESKEAVQNNKEQEQLQQQQEDKATDKSTQAQAMADKLASSIEKAMYEQLGEPLPGSKNTTVLQCGERYKNKFRSLLHNLKDKANQVFQIRVVTGDLSPDELVKMSSEDMANPELKSMSESLRAKSIKNSVLKLSEMPIIKKTHKGDIIMLPSERDSAFPEKRRNEQQKQQQRQEEQGAVAVSSEHNESRKSSMSATPTTPTVAKDESFNDILARIGVGAENDRGGATYLDPQRPKKRKAEVDLEKLLGDDDEEFRLEMDDDEGGGGGNDENSKDASTKQDNTENDMQVDHAVPTGPPKPPVIWNGRVNMPQVAHFDAFARQIGGRTMTAQDWAEVLSPTMWLEGRIPVDRVTNYITQTQYSSSREIAILEIEPVGDDGLRSALVLLDYFNTRRRYGVVAHNKTKVKDFYLIPLRKVEQLPDCLYVVRIEETQRDVDMFLGVVVMHKSNHQQPPPVSFAHQSFQPNPYQHQQPSHPFYGA